MNKIIQTKPNKLSMHPRNMRRFYPQTQVREMADSIAACRKVIHPLIVTEADAAGKYVVVDGNMRLAAARLLGAKCPPLECKIIKCSEAEQLVSMIVANQVRYDVDPVSEGLHYKALQKDEKMSIRQISKLTGMYEARIIKRKILADLPESIQKLIVEKKLPADERAARAFLSLPEDRSIKLAGRLARNPNIKIKTIIAAAEKLVEGPQKGARLKRPAAELSGALGAQRKKANFKQIRAAAKNACQKCNQYEGELCKTPEPAWSMVIHAADKTCSKCPLKDMSNICGSCPAVQLLRQLIDDE